jgi:ribosome silencing factor RsfS/YbeB/iojap
MMRATTWPSRSYLLAVAGELALAWLVIAVVTRLIANSLLRILVRYAAWAWVTLNILNLTDETRRLLDGWAFEIRATRLSIWRLVQAVVLIGALFALARFVSVTSTARVRGNSDISPSMQVLVIKLLQMLLYGGAFFIGLRIVGLDLTGLAVLSDAIGVGIGFGLQKAVSNLISGVIILLDKSIKPGDVISLGETFGWINSLGARYVSISTRDGRKYLIPNEDLITGQVVNWSHSKDFVRLDIDFGTAYGDDPHKVRKIAIEATRGVNRALSNPPTICHIVDFGDSSVDYFLRFWISDPNQGPDEYPRRCLSGAVGCVQDTRHFDPLPAARGSDAGGNASARVKITQFFTRNIRGDARFIEKSCFSCYLWSMPGTGAPRCAAKEDDVLSLMSHAAPAADMAAVHMTTASHADSETQLAAILKSLDDDKAEDIVQIDLRGKSAIGDYMVICSGRSSRQVSAISEKLAERLKREHGVPSRIEGKETGDWVLIDTGDVIVHVFRPEVRDFYQLEKMWLPSGQTPAARV